MSALIYFSAAFIAGVVFAALLGIALPIAAFAIAAFVPIAALILWWREPRGPFFFACGVLFLLGMVRYQAAQLVPRDALTRYHDAAPVALQGIIVAPPDVRDRSTDLRIEVESIRTPQGWRAASGTVLARLPRYSEFQYGDEVELSGVLHSPPVFGDFSYKDYLARQGVYSIVDRPRIARLASGKGNPFYATLFALRDRSQAIVEQSLPEPQASLLSGILLGQDRGIPPDTIDAFNRTGTSHIIAISGYNITIVAGFLAAFGGLFVRRRHTWLIVVAGIAAYVIFVGASASVVRAGIMGIVYMSATAFGRRSQALNALALAAFVMTLQSPFVLWDIGFELSFAATIGLIVLATPLSLAFKRWLEWRVPNERLRALLAFCTEGLWVTAAATLATLPIVVYDFHRFSLISIPVNLLVLPAQPALMGTGMLVIVGGFISPALAQILGWFAWPFLAWTTDIIELAARVPFASIDTGRIPDLFVIAYYVILVALVAYFVQPPEKRAQIRAALPQMKPLTPLAPLALVGALVWVGVISQPDGRLHVSFLDVGQGDATLVKTPSGQLIVIDGGPSPTSISAAIGRALPFYQRDIALVVLTRASDEKLTGLVSVLERYTVGQVVAPELKRSSKTVQRWRELIAHKAIRAQTATAGMQFMLDEGVWLEISEVGNEDEGIALRLSYGATSIVFDADGEQPRALRALPEPALIWKVGRHGDAQSVRAERLQAIKPQFAVISVGADNRANDPAESTLARLNDDGVIVYRTDQHGTVEFVSNGEQLAVETTK